MRIPEQVWAALKSDPEEAVDEVRLGAAVNLYEIGRLSSGAAAAVAGVPRTMFPSMLADYRVSTFRQTEDELREELANA